MTPAGGGIVRPVRVLVTDGQTRSSLAAVRALARHGYEVYLTAPEPEALGVASRFVRRWSLVPDPVVAPQASARRVLELSDEWEVDVIVPTTDATLAPLLIAARPDAARAVPIAGPSAASYEALSDKASLIELAQRVGVPAPRTVLALNRADVAAASRQIGLPCVIKPHRSVVADGPGARRAQVAHAATPAQVEQLALGAHPSAFPLLVQERITGPGEGAFFLADDGRIIAEFAHRRLRESPPSGGASTYREGVAVPDDLREYGARLLEAVGWSGVAMVEFKRCAHTGRAYLMEVNGRLWGSLQLAVSSGANFPDLMVRLALGQPLPARIPVKTGLRCRWWWGDVDHLLVRLRHSAEQLDLTPDAPSRLRVLRDFVSFDPWRDEMETWDVRDPRPFLRETHQWIRRRLLRRP